MVDCFRGRKIFAKPKPPTEFSRVRHKQMDFKSIPVTLPLDTYPQFPYRYTKIYETFLYPQPLQRKDLYQYKPKGKLEVGISLFVSKT